MKRASNVSIQFILTILLILGAPAVMAGIFGKTPLESPWKELFADIVKLNEFTQQNRKVQVRDALIENYDISGANLHAAVFEKTEWKNVIAKKIIMDKAVFKNSKFEKVSFAGANFSGVLFENSELIDVEFDEAQLSDVRFVSCKFKGADFWKLQHSKIKFDHALIEKSQFNDSSAELAFANSTLNNVDMRSLQASSSLTFEKSELKDVNADRSILSSLRATDSKVDATFEKAKIDHVEFSNDELDAGLDYATLGTLIVTTSKIKTLRMNTAHIDKVSISACTQTKNLGFYESTIRAMDISRSTLDDLDLADVAIELLTIRDTQLLNGDFKKLRAKGVVLENVTLDKKIDFTGAQVESLTRNNVAKLPGLNLITTGSNVKLD